MGSTFILEPDGVRLALRGGERLDLDARLSCLTAPTSSTPGAAVVR